MTISRSFGKRPKNQDIDRLQNALGFSRKEIGHPFSETNIFRYAILASAFLQFSVLATYALVRSTPWYIDRNSETARSAHVSFETVLERSHSLVTAIRRCHVFVAITFLLVCKSCNPYTTRARLNAWFDFSFKGNGIESIVFQPL